MTALIAFHGDKKLKQRRLAQVKAHRAADEIIHGVYWQDGKGCAVGCTVHSSDHFAYEKELGIPVSIAYLEDTIFENLENGRAKDWPVKFLEAIPVGADLSRVVPKLLHWILVDERNGVLRLVDGKDDPKDEYTSKVRDAINQVAELIIRWAETGEADASAARSAFRSVESAAWSAAWSAESAAWSAARSVESAARSVESVAWSAESAAWSAARSVESAAWSAAWSVAWSAAWSEREKAEKQAWITISEKLLELLKESPIP